MRARTRTSGARLNATKCGSRQATRASPATALCGGRGAGLKGKMRRGREENEVRRLRPDADERRERRQGRRRRGRGGGGKLDQRADGAARIGRLVGAVGRRGRTPGVRAVEEGGRDRLG